MMTWDDRQQEWIRVHDLRTDEAGRLMIPKYKWLGMQYTDRSIFNPAKHTLMVPSDMGCCLLTEGLHFNIV